MTISNNEVFTCDGCLEDYLQDQIWHMYSNNFYCAECYEETESFECPDCQEHYEGDEARSTVDDEKYCEDCIENEHFECNSCSKWDICEEDHGRFTVGEIFYCTECAEQELMKCDGCDGYEHEEDMRRGVYINLCQPCSESYFRCYDCSELVHEDNAHYHDDYAYCGECVPSGGDVHSYSYKPEPIFHHTRADLATNNLPYYGIELELVGDAHDSEKISALYEELNGSLANEDRAYIKYDSTVDIEVVTHPMSLNFHREKMGWNDVLELAKSEGYISHNADCAGLHIHISRSAFDSSDHIALFAYLFEYYIQQVKRITRRKEYQLMRWAQPVGIEKDESPYYMVRRYVDTNRARRTTMLNFSRETIEVRAFRGTLIHNSFMACLELVDCFYHLSKELEELAETPNALKGITWAHVVEYARTGGYDELVAFINRRGVE